ncbi:MAG: hypothetical protein R6V56_00950 [Lentisphaeria bacterium]
MLNAEIVWQTATGAAVVFLAMYVAIRLIRFAASFCLAVLLVGACIFAVVQIVSGQWTDWPAILFYSAITGFTAALLALPLLPFTHFWKKQ